MAGYRTSRGIQQEITKLGRKAAILVDLRT
jgi:hypothetical protein